MKKQLMLIALLVVGVVGQANAFYYVRVIGQAGSANSTDGFQIDLNEINGSTSVSYDSGTVADDDFGGSARSAASANLATGQLKALATDTDSVAKATAQLFDELLFDLPDGVSTSTVTFTLAVDGIISGQFNELVDVAELSLACTGVNMGCRSPNISDRDSVSILDFVSPTTLSVSLDVFEGQLYGLDARVNGFTRAFNPGTDLFDLSNTARLNVVLEDGVSFSSSSGVLLSVIPIPAAAWLFGSALGLLGWMKRRTG